MFDTFGQLVDFVAVRVGASRASDRERIDTYSEDALRKVWRRFQWLERKRVTNLQGLATVETTFSATKGLTTISRVDGPLWDSDPKFAKAFLIQFGMPGYKVGSVTDASTIELDRPWFEATDTGVKGNFYWDEIELPDECAEVVQDEIHVLKDDVPRLDWLDETSGRRVSPFPPAAGEPTWVTPGLRIAGADGLYEDRTLRFGRQAFDDDYWFRVGYLCHYPALPPADPERSAAKILIPAERRMLVAWHALSVAYSEHPFTDGTQAERFEGKYERELDIALRAEKEGTTDIAYLETFDGQ